VPEPIIVVSLGGKSALYRTSISPSFLLRALASEIVKSNLRPGPFEACAILHSELSHRFPFTPMINLLKAVALGRVLTIS